MTSEVLKKLNKLTEKDLFLMKLRGENIFLGAVYYPRIMSDYLEKLVEMGAMTQRGDEYTPSIEIEIQFIEDSGKIASNVVLEEGKKFLMPSKWAM